jgi:hypothetical protein
VHSDTGNRCDRDSQEREKAGFIEIKTGLLEAVAAGAILNRE